MAKFCYTIIDYARINVVDAGDLPLDLVNWLNLVKVFDCSHLSLISALLHRCGYRCEVMPYYVSELLDCHGEVCFASSSNTADDARQILFSIIPFRYMSNLKNPKLDKMAESICSLYIQRFSYAS